MIFVLQLGTDFLHPFRINWMTKFRTIVPCLINIGVTFCPSWRIKITGKELRLKSISLPPIRHRHQIMTQMHPQGCRIIRRQVLVSHRSAISMARIPLSIVVPSVTAYCAIRQECLSTSENCIAPKIDLEKVPTRYPPRMAWDGHWITGLLLSISIINMIRSVKGIWNLIINITRFSLAYPSAQVSRRELKKINNIHAKASKKQANSIIDSSSSNYDSSLSGNIDIYEIRHPTEHKETNKLDHVVTNNIKNKYQHNNAIEYESKFYGRFSLSIRTKDPLPEVTVSLWGCNKHR